jgi:hypothetical protein
VSEPANLRRLQEWMCTAITQSAPLEALPASPHTVLRSSSQLTATQRLGLYRRSYELRLLGAMRGSYPGLRHMLGHDLFDEFALDYLRARPSRSYTLQRLGDGFADHLQATRPDADGQPETWPDLMIDLARLERTFAEVYDAPGSEGQELPSSAQLPAEPDARWLAASIEPVRCLRLARSSFPAGPYLSAVRHGEQPPPPAPAESFLAVSRRKYAVTLTPLDKRPYRLLEQLVHGWPIDAAAAAAELDPVDAWPIVRGWVDSAFFQSLRPRHQLAGRSPHPSTRAIEQHA